MPTDPSNPAETTEEASSPEVLQVLVDNHRRFLAFLERRVESRAAAEDILQDAFVRGLDRADSVRDQSAIVPWFYRLLRNALVDHYRKGGAEARALELVGAAGSGESVAGAELSQEVCQCVAGLVKTLKPEYAAAIQRVDLDGLSVSAYAREVGITPNNGAVRLHRAHEALRRAVIRCCGTCATHGCFDCGCSGPSAAH